MHEDEEQRLPIGYARAMETGRLDDARSYA